MSRFLPIFCLIWCAAVTASAQTETWLRVEGPPERVERWRAEFVERGAIDAATAVPEQPSSTPRHRLRILAQVSAQVSAARQAAADLNEAAALGALVQAQQTLEENCDLPGAAKWLSEVQANLGIVAAQAGRPELADQAFQQMASLDPTRIIGPAEAPPNVIERAARISEAVATGATGSFVVDAEPSGAEVHLDGRFVGATPIRIEAHVGRHVVRVRAPGHVEWGLAMDVWEGQRPKLEVTLPLQDGERRRRALVEAATPYEGASALAPGMALWWIDVGSGEYPRVLWTECAPRGCAPPRRVSAEDELVATEALHPIAAAEWALERESALGWLQETEPPPPPTPWFRKWPIWVGVGAALALGGVALGFALQPEPVQRRRIVINPSDLNTQ